MKVVAKHVSIETGSDGADASMAPAGELAAGARKLATAPFSRSRSRSWEIPDTGLVGRRITVSIH
jgi:hypothetical protein